MPPIKALKPSLAKFTKSVTQLDYGEVETYHRVEGHKNGKVKMFIIFHALVDIDNHAEQWWSYGANTSHNTQYKQFPTQIRSIPFEPERDPRRLKNSGSISSFKTTFNPKQRRALYIEKKKAERPKQFKVPVPSRHDFCKKINRSLELKKDDEGDLDNDESKYVLPRKATFKFEEGGKATLNELHEVNLGLDEELCPTFIRGNMSQKKGKHPTSF